MSSSIYTPSANGNTTSESHADSVSLFPPIWSFIFRFTLRLEARILHGDDVNKAKRLLHEVYYIEQKWIPPPGNPSNLRIEHGRYEDDLGSAATWLGVYNIDTGPSDPVGVIRVLSELEHRRYLHKDVAMPWSSAVPIREMNRMAIRKGHRGGAVFPFLIFAGAVCSFRQGARILCGSSPSPFVRTYKHFGFSTCFGFRYHASDPHSCTIVEYPLSRRNLVLLMLRMVIWRLRRVVNRILHERIGRIFGWLAVQNRAPNLSSRPARI